MKTYGMVKTSVFFSYEGKRYLLESTLKKTIILKDWGGVGNWREKKREYWNICEVFLDIILSLLPYSHAGSQSLLYWRTNSKCLHYFLKRILKNITMCFSCYQQSKTKKNREM